MPQTSSNDEPVELVRETTAALFVINLCASTTPVTLAHPDSPELTQGSAPRAPQATTPGTSVRPYPLPDQRSRP